MNVEDITDNGHIFKYNTHKKKKQLIFIRFFKNMLTYMYRKNHIA